MFVQLYFLFSVNGYQEILWAEINVEEINNELIEFGNRLESFQRGSTISIFD